MSVYTKKKQIKEIVKEEKSNKNGIRCQIHDQKYQL
jgi:hypothetical protein